MPKRKMPSRIRYDLANPTISVRVSKDEYDRLDYIRQNEMVSWKELLLRTLDEKDNRVHLGKCSKCGKEYHWNLETKKNYLDQIVSEAHPLCKECKRIEPNGAKLSI